MPDVSKHIEQQEALKNILLEYDDVTRKLYNDILDLYRDKGLHLSKAAMITEIKDKVKEAAK